MANIPRYFVNTIFMVCIVFIFGVGLGSMTAYGLTRIDFLLRKKLNESTGSLDKEMQELTKAVDKARADASAMKNRFDKKKREAEDKLKNKAKDKLKDLFK